MCSAGCAPLSSIVVIAMYYVSPKFVSSSKRKDILNLRLKTVCTGIIFSCSFSVYKSPAYESMGFDLLKERLVSIGYPAALREFEYDASFPVRWLYPTLSLSFSLLVVQIVIC